MSTTSDPQKLALERDRKVAELQARAEEEHTRALASRLDLEYVDTRIVPLEQPHAGPIDVGRRGAGAHQVAQRGENPADDATGAFHPFAVPFRCDAHDSSIWRV